MKIKYGMAGCSGFLWYQSLTRKISYKNFVLLAHSQMCGWLGEKAPTLNLKWPKNSKLLELADQNFLLLQQRIQRFGNNFGRWRNILYKIFNGF